MKEAIARLRATGQHIPTFKKEATPAPVAPPDIRTVARAKVEKTAQKDLERELYETQERLQLFLGVAEHAKTVHVAPPVTGKKRPAVAVALASDWHVEEKIEPEKIHGLNEYDLTIAEARAKMFFQAVVWKTRHHQNSYDIKQLLLFLLGDFITGYIHPELMEGAQLSPVRALVFWKALMVGGIDMLLEQLPGVALDLPCTAGNHGRTTDKIRVNSRMENSFEWLGYHMLAEHYRDNPRVKFHIAAGAHVVVHAWDWKIRATHGDDIRYGGGIGGLAIPLHKAVYAWNVGVPVDYTVLGHWHQHADYKFAVCNGSLIGYSPFSQWVKASWEAPSQAYFLIDKERGKDYVSPMWVDPNQGARRAA